MFGTILGLVYGYTMAIIIGVLGGRVVSSEASSYVLYLIFMAVFFSLFIAPTMIRFMHPTKKYTFLKYF